MKNRFLRGIAVILSAVILAGSLFTVSFAAEKPDVYMISDKKDNKLILSVYYQNADKMLGTWFSLDFDKSLMKSVEVTHNNTADAAAWSNALLSQDYIEAFNPDSDKLLYTGAFLEDISAVTDNADDVHYIDIIFEIKEGKSFDVNGSVISFSGVICLPDGYCEINKEYTVDPLSDPDLSPRRYAGDINNDGKVTAADARGILRYSVSLEDIGKEDIPYANMDFNNLISAADARFALRSSVSLEQLHGHCYIYKDGKYICGYCKEAFELKLNHIHKYNYPDCYSTGVCECGRKNEEVRGHIYSASSPVCSVCGIDVGGMISKAEAVLSYTSKINRYIRNAEAAYVNADWYTVIEAGLYINVYYEDIVKTLENCNELKNSRDEFIKAKNITTAAADSVVRSGDISISRANADTLYTAAKNAAEYEKTALSYLESVAGKYLK